MEDVLYRLLWKVEPFWWTLSIKLMNEILSLIILKILVMEIKKGSWMFDQLCIGVQADYLLFGLKESSWTKCLICCFFYFLDDKSLLIGLLFLCWFSLKSRLLARLEAVLFLSFGVSHVCIEIFSLLFMNE